MSGSIRDDERALLAEIHREGGEPWERLLAKCRWEHMGQYAVLREWGDPRGWPPESPRCPHGRFYSLCGECRAIAYLRGEPDPA